MDYATNFIEELIGTTPFRGEAKKRKVSRLGTITLSKKLEGKEVMVTEIKPGVYTVEVLK